MILVYKHTTLALDRVMIMPILSLHCAFKALPHYEYQRALEPLKKHAYGAKNFILGITKSTFIVVFAI